MSDPLADLLAKLVGCDAPQQFVWDVLVDSIARQCSGLGLPQPRYVAGNIVVGDLAHARFVLSAHMDEASFSVTHVSAGAVTLAPCHRIGDDVDEIAVRLVGVRNHQVRTLGDARLLRDGRSFRCQRTPTQDVRLGDRAVYQTECIAGPLGLTAKAVDDRAGAVVALYSGADLHCRGIPVAIVLSDGEQNVPDGYFSRTFPHVLGMVHEDCMFVFIDGIFEDGLRREGLTAPPRGALIVPHSGDGRGYSVPPRLFALLRDDVLPAARAQGINARVSGAYHSRGDDWGLVTNPTTGANHAAFFVSFGGMGSTPARRTICPVSLTECRRFVGMAVEYLWDIRLGRHATKGSI